MRRKVDIDQLQIDISRGNIQPYICDVQGCNETVLWHDPAEEWVLLGGKMVNVGTGMGIVYSNCEHCGMKVCPHPSMKPRNGLPPIFCSSPAPQVTRVHNKIWTPGTPYNLSRAQIQSVDFGRQNRRMSLPGDFQDTKHCLVEAFYFDHNDDLQVISCCRNRECQSQFEDDKRQITRKAFHGA